MSDGIKEQKTSLSPTERNNVTSKHAKQCTNDPLDSKESQINGTSYINLYSIALNNVTRHYITKTNHDSS